MRLKHRKILFGKFSGATKLIGNGQNPFSMEVITKLIGAAEGEFTSAPDGRGMYSDIVELKENEYISFKHLGEVKENIEQPQSADWNEAFEIYSLAETAGNTQLTVTIDLDDKFADYFINTFPKAIQIAKNLAEIRNETLAEISAFINVPVEKVWKYWTSPAHIVNWNFASADWCCPTAQNDLRISGSFSSRMEAKDGSMGFDFAGTYTEVVENARICYKMADDREVSTDFREIDGKTEIISRFQTETTNPYEMQKNGWQAILNNFKKYVETN